MTKKIAPFKPSLIAALAAASICVPVHSRDAQWTGATSSWTDQEAWGPYPVMPGQYDKVFIDAYGGVAGSVVFPYAGYTNLLLDEPIDGTIAGLNIGTQGSLTLLSQLWVNGDVVNNGSLFGKKEGRYVNGSIYSTGSIFLGGQGTTSFAQGNVVRANGSLTIDTGHTLTGAGSYVSFNVENRGLILATGSIGISASPYATSASMVNKGVIRVVDGGSFGTNGQQLDNRGGLIDVSGGQFSGAVYGGTIQGLGSNSRISGYLRDTTFQGQAQTYGLTLIGEVANNGVLELTPLEQHGGYLGGGSARAVLSGSGKVRVVGSEPVTLQNLTLGSGQTFIGSAIYKDGLSNHGTMLVEGPAGLVADNYLANSLVNTGTMVVASGSRLHLPSTDNRGGHIILEGRSSLTRSVGDARITGGTVTGNIEVALGYITFADLTLEGGWRTTSQGELGLAGKINVHGSLDIGLGSDSFTYVTLHGDTELNGQGQTKLHSAVNWYSEIQNDGPYRETNHTLTFGQGHVLTGSGLISVTTVNKGLILASEGDRLQFNRSSTNLGTIRIEKSGLVHGADIDNENGVIDIADGGRLATVGSGRPTRGGVINGRGAGSALTGAFSNVTLTGTLSVNGEIEVSGTITNRGQLLLGNRSGSTWDTSGMKVNGEVVLQGNGLTRMKSGSFGSVRGEFGSKAVLTVHGDHRMIGAGSVFDLTLRNQGRIDVAEGDLALYRVSLQNEGALNVHQGNTLQSDSEITVHGRRATAMVDGTIEAPLLNITDAAVLTGQGKIKGDVRTRAGMITIDALVGGLSITGNLEMDEDSTLLIHGLGRVTEGDPVGLAVGGTTTLGGRLLLTFDSQAHEGDTFDILRSAGALTGTFSDLQILGTHLVVSLNYLSDRVSVSLSSPVPEPGTSAQFAIGAVIWGVMNRRRRAAGESSK